MNIDAQYQNAARDAILVQDACNLSGVVRIWDRAMGVLWEVARRDGKGTDWVNQHPISKVFAYKCALLSRVPGVSELWIIDSQFDLDYALVNGLAEGKTQEQMAVSV